MSVLTNEEVIKEWQKFYPKNKKIKQLISQSKKKDISNDVFFNYLSYSTNSIIGKIGIGYSFFNKITIQSIANELAKRILEYKREKNDILISSDNILTKEFIKEIAKVLNKYNIKCTTFKNYTNFDKKFCLKMNKKISLDGLVFIETNTYDRNLYEISLYDKNSKIINDECFYQNIIKSIKNDFPDDNNDFSIDFLSNIKTVEEYVSKVNAIETRSNDQRKIKIGMSNINEGTNIILKKMFGKLNYNYQIYKSNKSNTSKKIKKFNWNTKSIKKYFYKEILWAILNKCDILICSFENAKQLFCFLISKQKIIYLNADFLSLFFLHFFISELKRENISLSQSFISSDVFIMPQIHKIIQKYNLNYENQNIPKLYSEKYLLYHWNSSNQFVFGDDVIIEYSFYHLILKLVEIINYLYTQKSNILFEKNKLLQIYGSSKNMIFYELFNKEKIIKFLELVSIKKTIGKWKIDNIVFIKNTDEKAEEINICTLDFKEQIKLNIKYNNILNKIKFVFHSPNNIDNSFNLFSKRKQKRKITKIKSTILQKAKEFK